MFQFYWPWFALLLPLPLLLVMIAPPRGSKSADPLPLLRFPHLNRVKQAFPALQAGGTKKNRATVLFLSAAWVSLILALMRPELVDQFTKIHNEGHDIMLAVDISFSMKAVDLSTQTKVLDRLAVTKEVVRSFLKKRSGDRVGLIVFGGTAYLQVPFTLDLHSVGLLLDETLPGMAGDGTAIGDAIGLAIRTLRERPSGSRVLVLLTDGEDNSSSIPPLEAAKIAQQYGIRIYTIGIGNPEGALYPTQLGVYQMVQTPLDEKLLSEIAMLTGGQYFHAGKKEQLQEIYDKIDALEKTEAETEEFLIRDPLYAYPLMLALLFLLLATLRPIYRSIYGI